eukprot:CAMPEP_0119340820 /NCGR_PEP_ID=MMETSP1333-20130426/101069_1 /TAXON_ID=418940 /ORGANISM="Scyphosphaera apsteinii, Strain RCC1455" /LENGTH=119 /DNA_ID=CAMNT_0007352651 /DNA_START=126 /DNA_END=485 /DNA_ORIENTATION=-
MRSTASSPQLFLKVTRSAFEGLPKTVKHEILNYTEEQVRKVRKELARLSNPPTPTCAEGKVKSPGGRGSPSGPSTSNAPVRKRKHPHPCAAEFVPLMSPPSVKRGKAKMESGGTPPYIS